MQDGEHADDDHRQLQGDVGEGEDGQRPLAAAAGDVEDVEHAGGDDHRAGDADLPAGLGEVGGDRLQVVRDRDRRQGGDDQVVDQDRPAGDEGDQLVEGVAGEARGAAALAEHRPALDVAERGQHEEQAGGEEDQRRQAEAAVGDDAEREVDREADRRVDGDEEPGDAEAALQQAAPTRRGCAAPAGSGCAHRVRVRRSRAARRRPRGRRRRAGCRPRAGRRPLARVLTRITRPRTMKTSEKARTEPR